MDEFTAGPPATPDWTSGMDGLTFRVEKWNRAGMDAEALLATASGYSTAVAAYNAAVAEFPEKCIVLTQNRQVITRSNGESGGTGTTAADAKAQSRGKLTQRECQVLTLLLHGLSMKAVARSLGITARTVAFHKYKIMEANGLRDNVDLMNFGRQLGLLGLPALTALPPAQISPTEPEPCG